MVCFVVGFWLNFCIIIEYGYNDNVLIWIYVYIEVSFILLIYFIIIEYIDMVIKKLWF